MCITTPFGRCVPKRRAGQPHAPAHVDARAMKLSAPIAALVLCTAVASVQAGRMQAGAASAPIEKVPLEAAAGQTANPDKTQEADAKMAAQKQAAANPTIKDAERLQIAVKDMSQNLAANTAAEKQPAQLGTPIDKASIEKGTTKQAFQPEGPTDKASIDSETAKQANQAAIPVDKASIEKATAQQGAAPKTQKFTPMVLADDSQAQGQGDSAVPNGSDMKPVIAKADGVAKAANPNDIPFANVKIAGPDGAKVGADNKGKNKPQEAVVSAFAIAQATTTDTATTTATTSATSATTTGTSAPTTSASTSAAPTTTTVSPTSTLVTTTVVPTTTMQMTLTKATTSTTDTATTTLGLHGPRRQVGNNAKSDSPIPLIVVALCFLGFL